jgi:hypothetical protein
VQSPHKKVGKPPKRASVNTGRSNPTETLLTIAGWVGTSHIDLAHIHKRWASHISHLGPSTMRLASMMPLEAVRVPI